MSNLVICPVYNEAEYLKDFSTVLRKYYTGDLLFIDDGSTDQSAKIILSQKDNNTFLIRHNQRLGYGATLNSGFRFAHERGYRRIVTIDTDMQHDPEQIYMFFRALTETEVVLGSRYIRIDSYLEIPQDRFLINRYISQLIKVLFSVSITDPFCGFRGYRDTFLKKARLKESGYGMGIEILLELIRTKVAFKEIPIRAVYFDPARKFGQGLDNPKFRLLYYLEVIARKKSAIDEKQILSSQSPS